MRTNQQQMAWFVILEPPSPSPSTLKLSFMTWENP